MPIRDWKPALNRFMIELEEELTPHETVQKSVSGLL